MARDKGVENSSEAEPKPPGLAVAGSSQSVFTSYASHDEIWSPVFVGPRRDPRFKDIVRDIGLYDHWRRTGKWGDFARPLGNDDFECW
jgi:hypothetical protein